MKQRKILYAANIFDENEIDAICDHILSGEQIACGPRNEETEKKLAEFLGVKYALTVNSGSSANMLAFMTLTAHTLDDRNRVKKGDEVITPACCFPTTVGPIVNYGAIPVFVDVDLATVNIEPSEVEKAITDKTQVIMAAHTLGNPFDIGKITDLCINSNIWILADCCDSLGSKFEGKYLENFSDISTSSFFPAHIITSAEGGAVHTNSRELYRIAKSMRDWGRDYKCDVCKPLCPDRFKTGYDCRYNYNFFGYNLKITEMQAILLYHQINKLPEFIDKRRYNWFRLRMELEQFNKYFFFQMSEPESTPNPFSFLITLKEGLSFTRNELMQYLEDNGIGTRMLFAGNILKHKCMKPLVEGVDYRIVGDLKNTNYIMEHSFFIGCYPGITDDDIDYMSDKIGKFIKKSGY